MHLQRNYNNIVEPFPFSTFHLLRTCNRLIMPSTDLQAYYNRMKDGHGRGHTAIMETATKEYDSAFVTGNAVEVGGKSPILDVLDGSLTSVNSMDTSDKYDDNDVNFSSNNNNNTNKSTNKIAYMPAECELTVASGGGAARHGALPLPGFEYLHAHGHRVAPSSVSTDFPLMELNRAVFPAAFLQRRQRGEKRPIPDEQKDDKYYERRKRNNEAAKKSRDARKIREDRIAFRAALLEQENSLLRAQVVALRDELQALRQLLGTGAASPSLLTGRTLL